jgi:hypothetical protein
VSVPQPSWFVVAAAALLVAGGAAAQTNATSAQPLGLPDWSGWWGHGLPMADELRRNPPPFKPDIGATIQAATALGSGTDTDPDPSRYCRPQQFTGSSGGFTEAVEFLFTPGRVTITNEMGLIRRIYTDGRALPEAPDSTNTGFSVGRWEGQTLVVETVGINPQARYPGRAPGTPAIGSDVRITERIFLKDPGTLQFDIVTEAPDVLTQPDRRTRLYTRVSKTAANEITFCTDDDRSIEPGSGKQRFDMTPPPDLPPPPGR